MKSTISKQIAIPLCSSQLIKISAPTNRPGTNCLPFVRKIVVIALQTIHLCIIHNRNANFKPRRSRIRIGRSLIYTFTIYARHSLFLFVHFSLLALCSVIYLFFQLNSKLYIITYDICNSTSRLDEGFLHLLLNLELGYVGNNR